MSTYLIALLVVGWGLREAFFTYKKRQFRLALGKAQAALLKERRKHAAVKSKKALKNYHDLRDTYGRFTARP